MEYVRWEEEKGSEISGERIEGSGLFVADEISEAGERVRLKGWLESRRTA